MTKFSYFKLISTFLVGILLSSCNSKKENFDIDLSNFKVSKKNSEKILNSENPESLVTKKEIIINKLKNYQNKSEILGAVKFGKKDPFSEGDIELTKLDSKLQIKGFLNTDQKSFAFVNYSGRQGTIIQESIGGLNTDLLPDGAKVLKIDPENKKLIIEFQEESYTFEL